MAPQSKKGSVRDIITGQEYSAQQLLAELHSRTQELEVNRRELQNYRRALLEVEKERDQFREASFQPQVTVKKMPVNQAIMQENAELRNMLSRAIEEKSQMVLERERLLLQMSTPVGQFGGIQAYANSANTGIRKHSKGQGEEGWNAQQALESSILSSERRIPDSIFFEENNPNSVERNLRLKSLLSITDYPIRNHHIITTNNIITDQYK